MPTPSLILANNLLFLRSVFFSLFIKSVAYGMDSRPPMAIFELLDYIVNEVRYCMAFGIYLLLLRKKLTVDLSGKPLNCSHSVGCLGFKICVSWFVHHDPGIGWLDERLQKSLPQEQLHAALSPSSSLRFRSLPLPIYILILPSPGISFFSPSISCALTMC